MGEIKTAKDMGKLCAAGSVTDAIKNAGAASEQRR